MFRDFMLAQQHRDFWTYAAWLDIVTRYRRAKLGILWLLINPFVFVFGLGYVYSGFMGAPVDRFIPHLALGYPLWRLFIHVATESAQCIRASKPFVMEGQINLMQYILRVISKALFNYIFGLLVALVAIALLYSQHLIATLTLIITLPIIIINLIWIGTFVAIVSARLPETADLINTLLLFGFLMTPVMWEADRIPITSTLGKIVRMNPAFHMIEIVRAPVLDGNVSQFSLIYIAIFSLFGLLITDFIYRRYARYVALWI
ncbi:hypothetical protein CSC94_23705 [Zhengella mangrovi]|uniref:Transport permease protein n=1 Tax=Zhengella mangrovi TaxID=1982044 RepID=A0A2G1QH51_9HYPH|nr:ABC transporter permease [Zhengella mangrovi]PHP64568.1 hypothetical protein CSC94_23705 [Zhengella mangrovi]